MANPTTVILNHEDLGHGSYFESGLRLNYNEDGWGGTLQRFAAFTCNCSEDAIMARMMEEYDDPYEDPEEQERLLLHDRLVDEYLDQYSNDETIQGLTFTEWLELVAPVRPVDNDLDNDESEDRDVDACDL